MPGVAIRSVKGNVEIERVKTIIKKSAAVLFAVAVVVAFSACERKDSAMTSWSTDGGHLAGDNAGRWEAGTVESNVYTSKFSGLKIEPSGDNWRFASDDEMSSFRSATIKSEGLAAEETQNCTPTSRDLICDAVLMSNTDGSNIVLIYEKLNNMDNGRQITSKQYLAEAAKGFQNLRSQYSSVSEIKKETHAGQVFSKLETVSTPAFGSVKQTLYAKMVGDYILCINYTCCDGGQLQTMLDFVKPLA